MNKVLFFIMTLILSNIQSSRWGDTVGWESYRGQRTHQSSCRAVDRSHSQHHSLPSNTNTTCSLSDCCLTDNCATCCSTVVYILLISGLFSRTTWASRYKKGKTILDFNEARDDGWQWHQLNHMQNSALHSEQITIPACHNSTFYRLDALPATQPTV